jgi:hypothetical protein
MTITRPWRLPHASEENAEEDERIQPKRFEQTKSRRRLLPPASMMMGRIRQRILPVPKSAIAKAANP